MTNLIFMMLKFKILSKRWILFYLKHQDMLLCHINRMKMIVWWNQYRLLSFCKYDFEYKRLSQTLDLIYLRYDFQILSKFWILVYLNVLCPCGCIRDHWPLTSGSERSLAKNSRCELSSLHWTSFGTFLL